MFDDLEDDDQVEDEQPQPVAETAQESHSWMIDRHAWILLAFRQGYLFSILIPLSPQGGGLKCEL